MNPVIAIVVAAVAALLTQWLRVDTPNYGSLKEMIFEWGFPVVAAAFVAAVVWYSEMLDPAQFFAGGGVIAYVAIGISSESILKTLILKYKPSLSTIDFE